MDSGIHGDEAGVPGYVFSPDSNGPTDGLDKNVGCLAGPTKAKLNESL